jgi:hypothetical protein
MGTGEQIEVLGPGVHRMDEQIAAGIETQDDELK